jgi:hypothetical protein
MGQIPNEMMAFAGTSQKPKPKLTAGTSTLTVKAEVEATRAATMASFMVDVLVDNDVIMVARVSACRARDDG